MAGVIDVYLINVGGSSSGAAIRCTLPRHRGNIGCSACRLGLHRGYNRKAVPQPMAGVVVVKVMVDVATDTHVTNNLMRLALANRNGKAVPQPVTGLVVKQVACLVDVATTICWEFHAP